MGGERRTAAGLSRDAPLSSPCALGLSRPLRHATTVLARSARRCRATRRRASRRRAQSRRGRRFADQLLRLTEARHEIDSAARDLAVLERLGGRLVTAADAEWKLLAFTAFAGVDTKQRPEAHPPLALWVTGPACLDEVAERAAAIVGTRAATAYGEHVAAELAAGLAERDVAVVSGGAYGIDGAAHRAALAADGSRSRYWPAASMKTETCCARVLSFTASRTAGAKTAR
jgi:predicted Rossmann fold nucleotide-binding protein DprA/Smf involved in DNA uptake